MAELIFELAQEALRSKGQADAAAVTALALSGEADGTYLTGHRDVIPTWRQRAYNTEDTPVGKPYQWQGQVYRLWQQHDATGQPDWSPDKAVSLWDLCHTTDPTQATAYAAPQGTRGLWQSGECCVLNGHVWRCLADNTAYSPTELSAAWEDLGTVEEVQA